MLSAREQRRTATVGQKEEPMRAFVQDEKGRQHSSWTFPFPSGAISSWMPVGQASSSATLQNPDGADLVFVFLQFGGRNKFR